MGCEKCRCKLCGATIKADNSFELILEKGKHEEKKHPGIFRRNRKVDEMYTRKYRRLNDWLIRNQKVIFTASKWDGEDYAE